MRWRVLGVRLNFQSLRRREKGTIMRGKKATAGNNKSHIYELTLKTYPRDADLSFSFSLLPLPGHFVQ